MRRRTAVVAGAAAVVLASSGAVAAVLTRSDSRPDAATDAQAAATPTPTSRTASPNASKPPKRPVSKASGRLSPQPQSLGGWPNAGNTGVPPGARLTSRGSIVVTRRGAVLSNLDVHGDIVVQADNVTIRNTRVVNSGTSEWGVVQKEGASGLTVTDSEIRGNGRDRLGVGILNTDGFMTIRRVDISVVSDGIDCNQGLIESNYIHDPKEFPGDHVDLVAALDGPSSGMSLVIRHNTLINTVGQTSAVALFQDFGLIHDMRVENNLLAGGGYTVYGGGGKFGTPRNVRITGNVFSKRVFPKSGYYGTNTDWVPGPGNVWQDNVWEGTSTQIRAQS